jgi:hypothetical protein
VAWVNHLTDRAGGAAKTFRRQAPGVDFQRSRSWQLADLDVLQVAQQLHQLACVRLPEVIWVDDPRLDDPYGLGDNLRAAVKQLAAKGADGKARKETVQETLTYVLNNRERMDYPEYRRLGLPVSSALVESTIKQINRRIKGSEKFWLEGGAEALLQLRAAQLSEDDRWKENWSRRRKHRRAVGNGRLAQAA